MRSCQNVDQALCGSRGAEEEAPAAGGRGEVLTVREAAERAGVSESLIYLLCDERRLPHYRPGGKGKRGKILIDPRDLDAYMQSCRVDAEERPQVKTPAPKS